MTRHAFTLAGVLLAGLFVVLFFSGRSASTELGHVAPRVGMRAEELMAIGPRVATQTGATLGTSRQVVYLLACSGVPTPLTIEEQATKAASLVETQRLSGKEAVRSVIGSTHDEPGPRGLNDC